MVWAGHGAVMVQWTKDNQKLTSAYLYKQILYLKQYRNVIFLTVFFPML